PSPDAPSPNARAQRSAGDTAPRSLNPLRIRPPSPSAPAAIKPAASTTGRRWGRFSTWPSFSSDAPREDRANVTPGTTSGRALVRNCQRGKPSALGSGRLSNQTNQAASAAVISRPASTPRATDPHCRRPAGEGVEGVGRTTVADGLRFGLTARARSARGQTP